MALVITKRIVFNEQTEELRRESLLGELKTENSRRPPGSGWVPYLLTDEDDGALLRMEPAQ